MEAGGRVDLPANRATFAGWLLPCDAMGPGWAAWRSWRVNGERIRVVTDQRLHPSACLRGRASESAHRAPPRDSWG